MTWRAPVHYVVGAMIHSAVDDMASTGTPRPSPSAACLWSGRWLGLADIARHIIDTLFLSSFLESNGIM